MSLSNTNLGVLSKELNTVGGLPDLILVESVGLELCVRYTNNFWVILYRRVDTSAPTLICSHFKFSEAAEMMYKHLKTLGVLT